MGSEEIYQAQTRYPDAWLRPADFFWKFFSGSPFNLFRNLGDVFLRRFRIECVLRLTVPCIFRYFSRNFLIPHSCHDSEEKILSVVKTELNFLFYTKSEYLLLLWGKSFNQSKQLKFFKKNNTVPKATKIYNNNSTFVSPIYTFPWRETKLFTRQFKVQTGKSILFILYIEEKFGLWRETKTSPSISSFMDHVSSIFRRMKYGSNPSEMAIKVVIPAPTQ